MALMRWIYGTIVLLIVLHQAIGNNDDFFEVTDDTNPYGFFKETLCDVYYKPEQYVGQCGSAYSDYISPSRLAGHELSQMENSEFYEVLKLFRSANMLNAYQGIRMFTLPKLTLRSIIPSECIPILKGKSPEVDRDVKLMFKVPNIEDYYLAQVQELAAVALSTMDNLMTDEACEELDKYNFLSNFYRVYQKFWDENAKEDAERFTDWMLHVFRYICETEDCFSCFDQILEEQDIDVAAEITYEQYMSYEKCVLKLPESFKNFTTWSLTFEDYLPPSCLAELSLHYPTFNFSHTIRDMDLNMSVIFIQDIVSLYSELSLFYYHRNQNLSQRYTEGICHSVISKSIFSLLAISPENFDTTKNFTLHAMNKYCSIKSEGITDKEISIVRNISELLCEKTFDECRTSFIDSFSQVNRSNCRQGLVREKIDMVKLFDGISLEYKYFVTSSKNNLTFGNLGCNESISAALPDFHLTRNLLENFYSPPLEILLEETLLKASSFLMKYFYGNRRNGDQNHSTYTSDSFCHLVLQQAEILMAISPLDFNTSQAPSGNKSYKSPLGKYVLTPEDMTSSILTNMISSACETYECIESFVKLLVDFFGQTDELTVSRYSNFMAALQKTSSNFQRFSRRNDLSFENYTKPECYSLLKTKYPDFRFNVSLNTALFTPEYAFIQNVTLTAVATIFYYWSMDSHIGFKEECTIMGAYLESLLSIAPETFLRDHNSTRITESNLLYEILMNNICPDNTSFCAAVYWKNHFRSFDMLDSIPEDSSEITTVIERSDFTKPLVEYVATFQNEGIALSDFLSEYWQEFVSQRYPYIKQDAKLKREQTSLGKEGNIVGGFFYYMVAYYSHNNQGNNQSMSVLIEELESTWFFQYLGFLYFESVDDVFNLINLKVNGYSYEGYSHLSYTI